MSATELRERVRFDARITTTNDYGGVEGEWVEGVTVAARITPMQRGEEVLSRRLSGTRVVRIRVRRSEATVAIGSDARAVDVRTGETYNVRGIDPVGERRAYLDFLAESGGAHG